MRISSFAVAAAAAGLWCAFAGADILVFDVASGDWHVANNWDPPGIPTFEDRVVIPAGTTCIVDDDAEADTIEVELGGVLVIGEGMTLTLYNSTNNLCGPGADHSHVDGTVLLDHSGAGFPTVLRIASGLGITSSRTHSFSGDGRIEGRTASCDILIAAGRQMVNRLDVPGEGVRGSLTIIGEVGQNNGAFRNEGLVEVNKFKDTPGVLTLAATTPISDTFGARWVSEGWKTSMVFDREALNLRGTFTNLGPATQFYFNESVKTCGTYVLYQFTPFACGEVCVASTKSFSYTTFLTTSPGTCPNPGAAVGPPPVDCDNPYVITTCNYATSD